MYKNKKLKNSTHEALDLALLENDIEAMTKEYLLLGREIQNRIIPIAAYPYRWRSIYGKAERLNDDLRRKNYYIGEDGVHLKENYDIKKERREYLRYILIRLLAPSAKPQNAFDVVVGRYQKQTAYTEKERVELDALKLRFEGIFMSKKLPTCPNFLHFPSELKIYLAHLQAYYHPLSDILSELWHGTLKAGDDLMEFFRKYKKTETLSAFRSLPFPALFEIGEGKISLNEISENLFLFVLSGLMTKEFTNLHYAWEFYVKTYFYCYNTKVLQSND